MSIVLTGVHGRSGQWFVGGILTYSADDLFAEVAYLAQVLHWPMGTLLDLEHPDRHRLIELVSQTSEGPNEG